LVTNNYPDRSITFKYSDKQLLTITKEYIKTVFNYCIKPSWQRLPWGGFQYNIITLTNNNKIRVNSLETDVGTLNTLLTHYGVNIIYIESMSTSIENNQESDNNYL
jgi:hypothetical protein